MEGRLVEIPQPVYRLRRALSERSLLSSLAFTHLTCHPSLCPVMQSHSSTPPMNLADEKQNESLHEHASSNSGPVLDDYPGKGTEVERKLVRRVRGRVWYSPGPVPDTVFFLQIDLRLIPALGFMYACSLIGMSILCSESRTSSRCAGRTLTVATRSNQSSKRQNQWNGQRARHKYWKQICECICLLRSSLS